MLKETLNVHFPFQLLLKPRLTASALSFFFRVPQATIGGHMID